MFTKRWDYWLKTLEKGRVLEEPIPKIHWLGSPNPEANKNIESCLDYSRARMGSQAFSNFVDWLLYGFGDHETEVMPPRVDPETNSQWYRTFNRLWQSVT